MGARANYRRVRTWCRQYEYRGVTAPGADGALICIEANRELAAHVNAVSDDPRITIVHSSAQHVREILRDHGFSSADYIVSGIPFSTMPPSTREAILLNSFHALRPGGEMLVYQFSGTVLPSLKLMFGTVIEEREPLNVLPARIFRCIKPDVA